MSRIDTLQLYNFKFFNEQEPIKLDGKHLLLYGENGSGKSSIYWALYTLFEASQKEKKDIEKYFKHHSNHPQSLINIHTEAIYTGESLFYDSFISVKTKHTPPLEYKVSLLDTNIKDDVVAKEVNQASDFISYKVLYKFQDFWNGKKMDLTDIFIGHILSYINFPAKDLIRNGNTITYTSAWDMYKEIKKGPGKTTNDSGKEIQVYKSSLENRIFNEFVVHFNDEMKSLIDFININAPDILKKLGYDIDFELDYNEVVPYKGYTKYSHKKFEILFKITSYLGTPIIINRPQSFLNEAKITAIAIAIRLTILKKRINSEAGDILKFIVFDDVMISLDMNNRDRLLDFLLNPDNNFTKDYQLLFLTHDKSFYDFLAYKISKWDNMSNWVCKEMYTGKNELTKKEYPIIIESELEFIDKAKKYYEARDFTASSIYIRKEIEKLVNKRLPDELKLKTDGTFLSLQTLWNNLVERYTSLKKPISNDLKELFSQTKLMVLNPQAHFQSISSPLYKFELDRAFELVDKIEKECPIPEKTILLGKGMKLIYKHHSENYILYLELMSDFTINLFEIGDKQVLLPKCKILKWSFKDVDFLDVNTSKVMKYNIKKPIIHSLGKVIDTNVNHSLLPNTINLFLENTQIENSIWGLKEIIDKAEISFRYDFIHRKMIASIS
tara:strand:- start:3236 stop:5239 length:2004 start_codon:yes stop_codon:yes gene_type:complete